MLKKFTGRGRGNERRQFFGRLGGALCKSLVQSHRLESCGARPATDDKAIHPDKVAAFYASSGSISLNGAPPVSIAEVARGFMRDFPDLVVKFDRLEKRETGVEFHWTFAGTNTGPGGTGNRVRISGYELWKIDDAGLIAQSTGHFDVTEYERQLRSRDGAPM